MNTCNRIELSERWKEKDGEMFREIRTLTEDFRPSVHVINDHSGNTLTECKDILKRWNEYAREMYEDTIKTPDTITKV